MFSTKFEENENLPMTELKRLSEEWSKNPINELTHAIHIQMFNEGMSMVGGTSKLNYLESEKITF